MRELSSNNGILMAQPQFQINEHGLKLTRKILNKRIIYVREIYSRIITHQIWKTSK